MSNARPRLALPLAATLLLAACSVKAPPQSSWTILGEPRAAAQQPRALRADDGPALGMGRFSAAPDIRRTDLAWRSEDGRQVHETDDRWVDYPDRMLEELTRSALLQSGRFSSVTTAPPSAGLDLVLQARVLDFTEWHSGDAVETRVAIEWRLTRTEGDLLAQDVVRASRSVEERSVAGAVRAYQAAAEEAVASLVTAVTDASERLGIR